MNPRANKLWRRSVVAAAAVAMSLVGATGVAHADDASVANIDPNATGSLIIHKSDAQQGAAGDGTEQQVSGNPLGNVKFTIWQLGKESGGACKAIDLTDADAWQDVPTGTAPASTGAVQSAGYCLVSAAGTSGSTDASGALTFGNLDLGLYYVQETDASGATSNGKPVSVVSQSAPFYVSVPLPNKGSWLYDVNVYPKNQLLSKPAKTINGDADQKGLAVGDTVEWTIKQTVPTLNSGETYTSAKIWDTMPADGSLAYAHTSSVTLDGAALVEGTDYTVDANGVTWTLTNTGLGKLQAGQTLQVTFTTTVLKVTGTGEIANPGSGQPGTPGYGSQFNNKPNSGEPTPYTYWGALKVTKTDQDSKALSGAEFKVFPKTGATCAADVPGDGLVSTGTSGDDGVVRWTPNTPAGSSPLGLFVANSSNGPLQDPSKDYCLYETKVPAGYTGVGVQTVTIKAGSTNTTDLTVKNTQKNGPGLPLTGAEGQRNMMIAGILLLAAAVIAMVVTRRRQHN